MKVVDDRNSKKIYYRLTNMDINDTFLWNNQVWIKTKETQLCEKFCSAYCFDTGDNLSIGSNAEVVPVETELHIIKDSK